MVQKDGTKHIRGRASEPEMPALPRNTYRTPFGFQFRVVVPVELRVAIGKREVKKSLGRDYRAAVSEAHAMAVRVDNLFSEARAQSVPHALGADSIEAFLRLPADKRLKPITEVTPELIAGLKSLWLSGLDADVSWRRAGLGVEEFDELSTNIAESKVVLAQALARGDTENYAPAVRSLLVGRGYELLVSPSDERRLVYELMSAFQQGYDVLEQRQAGRAVPTPVSPAAPLRAAWEVEAKSGVGITWDELLRHWKSDRDRPEKTVADVETFLASLRTYLPQATPVSLSRADVTNWLRNERVERGNKAKTLEKKGTLLGALFSVAVKDELLERNPFAGFDYSRFATKEGLAEDEEREPFTVDQLKRIFSSDEGVLGVTKASGGGGYYPRVWFPLVALLSGARLDEIGSLVVDDVKLAPVPHFVVLRAKTQSSVREVPIHPKLIELGFLTYVEDIRKAGGTKLWPTLNSRSEKTKDSEVFGKWFNRYIHDTLKMPSNVVFHSFRHTFKDMCRDALIPREVHHAITGHADDRDSKNVGDEYGRGVSLEVKLEQMSNIKLPFKIGRPHRLKTAEKPPRKNVGVD